MYKLLLDPTKQSRFPQLPLFSGPSKHFNLKLIDPRDTSQQSMKDFWIIYLLQLHALPYCATIKEVLNDPFTKSTQAPDKYSEEQGTFSSWNWFFQSLRSAFFQSLRSRFLSHFSCVLLLNGNVANCVFSLFVHSCQHLLELPTFEIINLTFLFSIVLCPHHLFCRAIDDKLISIT